jgi:hypothetical protein
MDRIEFDYDLSVKSERLKDMSLKAGFARQVEVVEISPEPGKPAKLIAWGELTSESKAVSDGESVRYTATIEPYHFGSPLNGMKKRRPTGAHDIITLHGPILFNPEVDGQIEYNRSPNLFDSDVTHQGYCWVDPDSVRTAAARSFSGETGNEWLLRDVVATMCWACNPSETYIQNPKYKDFTKWLDDAPPVKNLRLPPGLYLSDYLDLILNPYGYAWRFTYKLEMVPAEDPMDPDVETRVVSFVVFKLGEGPEIRLYQQKPGDTKGAQHTLSSVSDWEVETDIGGISNKVRVVGDYVKREITVELYRGWPVADDAYTAAQLTQSADDQYEDHQRAWRLWVGNEGGDYCSTRSGTAPIPSTALDLTAQLGLDMIPRRRRMLDCLTHFEDDASAGSRRRRPPFIEWYNTDNEWAPIPNGWGETILTDQIGIYFAGDSPPEELIDRGSSARIRVTFTVESDHQLTASSGRVDDSINLRTREITIDASDRYYDQRIETSGLYPSALAGDPSSEARNDTTAIGTYATSMRILEDAACMRGKFKVVGLNSQYVIGKVVNQIYGRNIDLNRMADTAGTQRYMQIMSVTYDHKNQSTVIVAEPINEQYEA